MIAWELFKIQLYFANDTLCTIGQKKKKNTAINYNENYQREMKLTPINVDYCLLQFDALKFFLRVRLDGGEGFTQF